MPSTIDVAFVEEYNADVHLKFRQRASRLMSMTRRGTVQAKTVYWQIFGLLVAQTKTRNAQHSFIDPEHTKVSATMADWYVPTLVDDLDLLKLNIDERGSHTTAQVAALGKKADEIIMTAMAANNGGDIGSVADQFGYGHAMAIVTKFNVNEVPDDGQRFAALHPYAMAQLMKVPEFAHADYIGYDQLPWKGGLQMKSWMGVNWFTLPNAPWSTGSGLAANVARNFAWHKDCVGHGVNAEIDTKWDWENTYSAWSCVSSMSMGTRTVDTDGMFLSTSLSPAPDPTADN